MNLSTRARALQRATGWPYQRCIQAIRELGAAPAELARANGWRIDRADLAILAPGVGNEKAFDVAPPTSGLGTRTASKEPGLPESALAELDAKIASLDPMARLGHNTLANLDAETDRFDTTRLEHQKAAEMTAMAEMEAGKAALAARSVDHLKSTHALAELAQTKALHMSAVAEMEARKAALAARAVDHLKSTHTLAELAQTKALHMSAVAEMEARKAASAARAVDHLKPARALAELAQHKAVNLTAVAALDTQRAAELARSVDHLKPARALAELAQHKTVNLAAMAALDNQRAAELARSVDHLKPARALAELVQHKAVNLTAMAALDNQRAAEISATWDRIGAIRARVELEHRKAARLATTWDRLNAMLDEDRRQWLQLHLYDQTIPNFKTACMIAGSGFASVVDSMAAANRFDVRTYGTLLHETGRAFTSYMGRTGDMARAASPRGRDVLSLALELGATHFRATNEVTARLLAQQVPTFAKQVPTAVRASQLELLDLERDELIDRAALDHHAEPSEVAEGAVTVRLAHSIRELLTCVVDCNEAARFRGKDNVFSPTNKGLRASACLPLLLPRDLRTLKEAVEHLYFLIYEGAGSDNLRFEIGKSECGVFQRTENEFTAVMDLKFLRSKWLCHDPEHGGNGTAKSYRDVMTVFGRLGLSGEPASPEDYQKLYLQLVDRLRVFLDELRTRLRRNL